MQPPNFYRVGAGAALLGALVGLVFNVLHPRSTDALDSVEAELQLVADSGIWKWDHIMLGFAVAIGFIGFVAINFSMFNGPGDSWARAATIFGAVSAAVLLVLLVLDGTVTKNVADQWAAGDEAILPAATVLVETTRVLLTASIALFFGLTPLLFAEALWASAGYSNNLAYTELAGGAIGLLTALWIAIGEFGTGPLYAFLIASLLHTIVLFLAGWTLWKSPSAMRAPVAATPTV